MNSFILPPPPPYQEHPLVFSLSPEEINPDSLVVVKSGLTTSVIRPDPTSGKTNSTECLVVKKAVESINKFDDRNSESFSSINDLSKLTESDPVIYESIRNFSDIALDDKHASFNEVPLTTTEECIVNKISDACEEYSTGNQKPTSLTEEPINDASTSSNLIYFRF